jgi:hypothetical protein
MAAPIGESTTTKTLVSWVTLDTLTQHGGSALTLESTTTNAFAQVFDTVDYAERSAGQWMAGSNDFVRSPANGGAAETSTGKVAVAIAYDSAHGITLYRNGAFYAGYTAASLQAYQAGASDVLIGLRHSGCSNNCWLSGKIDEARIYPVALNACQVKLLTPEPYVAPTCPAGAVAFEGKCYQYVPTFTTQPLARQTCQTNFGGDLASLHSAGAKAFLSQYVDPNGQQITPWIGGVAPAGSFDAGADGIYTWTDGSAWDFQAWRLDTGEPSGGPTGGACIQFWPDANGFYAGWNDVPCSVALPFICEFAPSQG